MLDYRKLKNPPVVKDVLQKILDDFLSRLFVNEPASIIGFSGCGKTAYIEYLVRNRTLIPEFPSNHIVGLLDLELFSNPKLAWSSFFIGVSKSFGEALPLDLETEIETISKSGFEPAEIISFFHKISFEKNHKISLILDNFHLSYEKQNPELVDFILSLKKINPMNIGFGFLATSEYSDTELRNISRLAPEFLKNITWSKELFFDEESIDLLIRNEEEWNSYQYDPKFILKLKEMTLGDPSLTKMLAKKGLKNEIFITEFLNTQGIKDVYELIGESTINTRYRAVLNVLLPESLKFLAGDNKDVTEYLVKTGLFYETGSNTKPLNPVFGYFLETNKELIKKLYLDGDTEYKESQYTYIRKKLSGQELLVFDLLEENRGEIVSKDRIAEALWGDAWEESYSDWAIDKVISRLRSSLESESLTLTTFKSKGVALI
jgi:hypothetical protein